MTEREKCTATSKQTGKRCGAWPVPGATVCRTHGGAAPQVQAKAAERVVDQQARRALADIGDFTAVDNPLTELALLAGRARQWMHVMAERVADLERFRYTTMTGGEELRAEVALYERAMDRTAKMLESIAKLNIDERLAVIDERRVERILTAIEAALAHVGVTDIDQVNEARAVAGRHLTAV